MEENILIDVIQCYNQRQFGRLQDIKNDPILRSMIEQAYGDDLINLFGGLEATFSRFDTLKKIYKKKEIDSLEYFYNKGILYPLYNLSLATSYLSEINPISIWNDNYKLKTGVDRFQQTLLTQAASFTADTSRNLKNIMRFEK